ncbi:hypothetical protein PPERSA_06635 [Pseudocohnilembus persalinus]|uniref:Transmembrane protein n=1 Tax=Pseudocohnilembus persalinus TaxID=266149 RepID=A0A0V0QRU6_PSEPJ|nr:hypothetical protein PPERSA_06635 [Pseudocohnilembus persalinus]|eukprot:KRX05001.1 hypothetical protein PPERSA_06635 [Pseudocohnilembus persalinus]
MYYFNFSKSYFPQFYKIFSLIYYFKTQKILQFISSFYLSLQSLPSFSTYNQFKSQFIVNFYNCILFQSDYYQLLKFGLIQLYTQFFTYLGDLQHSLYEGNSFLIYYDLIIFKLTFCIYYSFLYEYLMTWISWEPLYFFYILNQKLLFKFRAFLSLNAPQLIIFYVTAYSSKTSLLNF